MQKMSGPRRLVVLLGALAVVAAGCTSGSGSDTAAPPTEVRIGLLTPLTGANKSAGQDAQRGAQLAADVVNNVNSLIPLPLAEGSGLTRLGNARIKIVPADTRSDAQRGANEAVRLVADQGVVALVGAYDPEVTLAASQRSERQPVPFVTGDSSLSYLTQRGLDWFFRTGPSVRTAGEGFFSLLKGAQKSGPTPTLGVLYASDKAGNDVLETLGDLADEGGYQIVKKVQFPADPPTPDLRPEITQMQQANPDVVFLAPTAATAPALVKAFADRRYKPKGIMAYGSGFLSESVLKSAGSAGVGLCREVSWSYELASRNLAAREVDKLYQNKHNVPMPEEAASSFTAVYTLAMAINNAGVTEGKRVRSALLSLDVPGQDTIMPWQGVRFDETHQNVNASSAIEQFADKTFHVVFPKDSSTRELAWPASNAA
jgi:branched-chain amino acid transport system substrate-binding protein